MIEESGRNQQAQSVIRSPGVGRRILLSDAEAVALKVVGGELGGTLYTFWNESELPARHLTLFTPAGLSTTLRR